LPVPPPLDLPAHWWGPFGRRPNPLTIQQLIANQTLDSELAAWLWVLIEAGASVLVCAGPGGAGKTTLLTGLTAFLSPDRSPYVVRGAFDALDAISGQQPSETVLLINEISNHLPIYTWGAGARHVFDAGHAGAQLLATAHATNRHELAKELTGPLIDATDADLRLWDLVLFIDAWRQGPCVIRRVADLVCFSLEPPVTRLVTGIPEGELRPAASPMQRLARRLGRPGATIEAEVQRRQSAFGLAP